jgi:hypothetical protein
MTKIQSTGFGFEAVVALALVVLSALAVIAGDASLPAGERMSSYETTPVSTMETGSISINAVQRTIDVSKLPVQDGYLAC